jgi:hypothetical protein
LSTIGSGVDATDAIDATDAAMVGGMAAASTTDTSIGKQPYGVLSYLNLPSKSALNK